MANVIINDTNLFNIANAIRSKNGSSDTYKPSEMAAAITNLPSGGGGDIDIEPIVLTGNQGYGCTGVIGSKFIELFGDKVSTEDMTDINHMFYNYGNATIPFDLNVKSTTTICGLNYLFSGANKLVSLPKITGNFTPYDFTYMFSSCINLREIPDDYFDGMNFTKIMDGTAGATSYKSGAMFMNCNSLRKFPMSIFEKMNPKSSYAYTYYSYCFYNCNSLDELVDLPIPYTAIYTSNLFGSMFKDCNRVKRITFILENGIPKVMSWKSQTIDLSSNIGYSNSFNPYNSGITADKGVKDAATYEALKNDPDWFTTLVAYSRYNRTSAVETINSLPDTSAYLASAGGTNTIKFKGESGSATDGGAINTMTEAEIAVAAAKGWTVSFA